ncbi:MAG TPA: hypothetical protein VMV49_08800 [Candidatus Deferrimicrobium sp.]|nr:hypothetical protein [Candidatus Deferrimicrobium sp.]
MARKCPDCGLAMKERIIDPIFQKKEYYCEVCELARKISRSKYEKKKQQNMILEEIQRRWDFRLDERNNYEQYCKSSKLKLTYEKYQKYLKIGRKK